EVWFTICDEQEIFQDFLNTSKSSNDNTNIVSAPQEPFVFNQDPGENSSQSPSHIDHHCCYGCGDSLDGIFCQRCTCKSCENGAHYVYNCPPKVPIISNMEPCHNQNVDEFPQTLTSFHPTCYSGDKNSFAYDSTSNFVDDSPNVFNPPPQPLTYSYEFCGNDAQSGHDCPPQFPVIHQPPQETRVEILHDHENDRVSEIKDAFGNKQYKLEDVQELIRKLFNDVQNIHELSEYINIPSWNRPAFCNYDDDDYDDEDYTITITPEDPVDSLIMKDEHLETIPATESDEVIKSNVEYLVPIPSESEGIPDNMCDVPFRDNSSPLDVSKEEVEDDILREKLLNINLFIAKIESLNDNLTPDRVLKSPSPFPIPVEDSDFFFEKSDTSLSYSDNSLPEFETFSDHTEETSSGNTTTHDDYSLPKYDSFIFQIEPDQGELTSVVMEDNLGEPRVHIFYFDIEEKNSGSIRIHVDISLLDLECFNFKSEPDPCELTSIVDSGIRENVLSATNVNLSHEDDQSPLLAHVVWIFLSFLTYPVAPPYLLSSGYEDTIFDPGISIYHSLFPGVSHRNGTFMKFNVYPNHLNESSMEILSFTCFSMDQ
nr:hypothetical protein [Tanacetum cinerariifolium]